MEKFPMYMYHILDQQPFNRDRYVHGDTFVWRDTVYPSKWMHCTTQLNVANNLKKAIQVREINVR